MIANCSSASLCFDCLVWQELFPSQQESLERETAGELESRERRWFVNDGHRSVRRLVYRTQAQEGMEAARDAAWEKRDPKQRRFATSAVSALRSFADCPLVLPPFVAMRDCRRIPPPSQNRVVVEWNPCSTLFLSMTAEPQIVLGFCLLGTGAK